MTTIRDLKVQMRPNSINNPQSWLVETTKLGFSCVCLSTINDMKSFPSKQLNHPEISIFDAKEWVLGMYQPVLLQFSLSYFWLEKFMWLNGPNGASAACVGSICRLICKKYRPKNQFLMLKNVFWACITLYWCSLLFHIFGLRSSWGWMDKIGHQVSVLGQCAGWFVVEIQAKEPTSDGTERGLSIYRPVLLQFSMSYFAPKFLPCVFVIGTTWECSSTIGFIFGSFPTAIIGFDSNYRNTMESHGDTDLVFLVQDASRIEQPLPIKAHVQDHGTQHKEMVNFNIILYIEVHISNCMVRTHHDPTGLYCCLPNNTTCQK